LENTGESGKRQRRRQHRQHLVIGIPVLHSGFLPPNGLLAYDGNGKVQCHICGRWYKNLEAHTRQTHQIEASEYREEFGLNRLQPLCSPEISRRLGQSLRQTGLVGKHPWKEPPRSPPVKMRLQGRQNASKAATGSKKTLTERKLKAQRENRLRGFILKACDLCGIPIQAMKGQHHSYCKSCKPKAKRQYMKEWGQTHREEKAEYMRRWYARHPGYGRKAGISQVQDKGC